VERWLVDLCEEGRSAGFAMDIAVLQNIEGLFAKKASDLGLTVYHCEGSGNPIAFIRSLRRLLRERGPYDAIHCHLHAFSGFAVLAARLAGVPARVVHSHNVVQNSSQSIVRRIYIRVARTLIGTFATAGIAPSAAAAEDLLGPSWRDDPRWSVLPCGIDLAPFHAPLPAISSRAAFGIPADALVLASVGRLTSEKNSEFLVDIFAAVLARAPNAYLLMIGEGALRDQLASKARQGGFGERLVLAGTRSDVAAILRGAVDVFVFPSPREALPIAVVEAQAAGLPTVISDGVPPEAIIVPELVAQLPVAAGAERWADAVLEQSRIGKAGTTDSALARVEQSDFNCAQTLKALARIYALQPVI
jgi:glycosyltransferase involved in cell wall biosynthesis